MKPARLAVAIVASALAGLARAAPAPARIADLTAFLVEARCADGGLQVVEGDCVARLLRAGDPIRLTRRDWPAPVGYVAQDGLIGPDGPETIWDFAPFGRFVPTGDGGEVYAIEGRTVRIALTQDGGKPYLQGFYGKGCGGTGWVAFGDDAPTGAWASLVARLDDRAVPSPCGAGHRAFTRYRLEAVAAPWIIDGARREITLPTVISEHYDSVAITSAHNMERSFFAKGVGRLIWEAWSRGRPVGKDIAVRCPGTAWSTPPAPGWSLSDCRYATNLVAVQGAFSGDAFGWPPRLSSLP